MKKITLFWAIFMAMCSITTAQSLSDSASTPATSLRGAGSVLYNQDGTAIGHVDSGIVATELGGLPANANEALVADDFVVPDSVQWVITGIDTVGFSNQLTLPDSFTVRFYSDNAGSPGAQVYEWNGIPTNGIDFEVQNIDLSSNPVVLGTGRHWVSVHAVNDTANALANFRWNWRTGPVQFGEEWFLRDEGLFGGMDWTPASGLAITDVSTAFVLTGTSAAAIPTLGEWGLIAFIALLAGSALVMLRKGRNA